MMYAFKDLDFKLEKSDRKTLSIYVERDGSLTIRAPNDITDEKLSKIIERKGHWIHKSKNELEELNK